LAKTGLAVTARRSTQAHNLAAALALIGACLAAGTAFAQTGPAPAAGPTAVQPVPTPATPGAAAAPTNPTPAIPGAANGQPAALASTPPSPPPPAPGFPPQPQPVTAGAPAEQRGFLNGFSKWWDQSVADWKAKMKEQQTKLDDFNKQSADAAKDAAAATQQAMKNAADALRPSHVIEIQQTCPLAGNGAADCATAATNVCKSKGFTGGQPLDVRTAEKCADSLWVSGQTPTRADCPVETVLLRAACQ
jgi:hypothetical protein